MLWEIQIENYIYNTYPELQNKLHLCISSQIVEPNKFYPHQLKNNMQNVKSVIKLRVMLRLKFAL